MLRNRAEAHSPFIRRETKERVKICLPAKCRNKMKVSWRSSNKWQYKNSKKDLLNNRISAREREPENQI